MPKFYIKGLKFPRFFSGKFQYLGNCAGVKHLTNIMSAKTSSILAASASIKISLKICDQVL